MAVEISAIYDINSACPENHQPGVEALCLEILYQDDYSERDAIHMKISGRNGIVPKLKRAGFDIWKIAGRDSARRYETLKLIKLLYRIEKGPPKKKSLINITRMFTEPSLENLEKSSPAIASIRENIYPQIPAAESNAAVLANICAEWKKLLLQQGDFVFDAKNNIHYNDILNKMQKANESLRQLSSEIAIAESTESVFQQFMVFLVRYEMRSIHHSFLTRQQSDTSMERPYDTNLASGYIRKMAQNLPQTVSWEQIQKIEALINTDYAALSKDESARTEALELTLLLSHLMASMAGCHASPLKDKNSKKHVSEAFHYSKTIATWLEKCFPKLNCCDAISFSVLAGIIQTIFLVSEMHEKYSVLTYGGHETRTLMAALRNDENPAEIVVFEWKSRIANRILHIQGGKALIAEHHQLQQSLAELAERVLSSNSIKAIEHIHNQLHPQAVEICKEIYHFE